ncbi:MAG: energy-coupling factor transporter transmembrane component T [Anaerolineae bacterium]
MNGFYTPGGSWLYRLDPRVRLWMAALAIVLSLALPRPAAAAAVLAALHMLLLLGGVPTRSIGLAWRALGPLVLAILLLQPLVMGGDGAALLTLGPLQITSAGIQTGIRYALQMSSAAFAVLLPIVTTPLNQIVQALHRLGLPYRWSMVIGLALHYLGTLGDLYITILEAQQARGLDLTHRGVWKRARALLPTLIALVIASLRLSDALALGLAARGFALQGRQRTSLNDMTMRPVDWLVGGAAAVVCGAVLAATLISR